MFRNAFVSPVFFVLGKNIVSTKTGLGTCFLYFEICLLPAFLFPPTRTRFCPPFLSWNRRKVPSVESDPKISGTLTTRPKSGIWKSWSYWARKFQNRFFDPKMLRHPSPTHRRKNVLPATPPRHVIYPARVKRSQNASFSEKPNLMEREVLRRFNFCVILSFDTYRFLAECMTRSLVKIQPPRSRPWWGESGGIRTSKTPRPCGISRTEAPMNWFSRGNRDFSDIFHRSGYRRQCECRRGLAR